jgi:hypothetical protein
MALTLVTDGGSCASACVFAYLGGVRRMAEGSNAFGLHRPYFSQKDYAEMNYEQSQAQYDRLVQHANEYLSKMGARPGLMQEMLAVPSHDVRFLGLREADYWGLRGDDPGYDEWSRAQQTTAFGEKWVHGWDMQIDCINKGGSERECNRFLKARKATDSQ